MFKAIIALGNIGEEYAKTYHNVGVLVAKEISSAANDSGKNLLLYEPKTFMNVSGPAILSWMKMRNLKIEEVLIVHDEGDLVVGEYKISSCGGSAGHNGIASVISAFKTEEFYRLRIGIRDPNEKERRKTLDFVLNNWSSSEEKVFLEVAKKAYAELASSFLQAS